MSPFADLIRVATQPPRTVPRSAIAGDTRTADLLRLLDARGSMSTTKLAEAAGLSTRLVWGLLKGPRAAGRVAHDARLWSINRDFCPDIHGADVQRAAELLRAHGWFVEPPEAFA